MNLEQNLLRALVAENRPEAMVNAVKIAGPEMSYEQVFAAIMEMSGINQEVLARSREAFRGKVEGKD